MNAITVSTFVLDCVTAPEIHGSPDKSMDINSTLRSRYITHDHIMKFRSRALKTSHLTVNFASFY
jgi:hypothetical protein